MGHSASNLLVHLIFSTRDRCEWITPEIRGDLFAYVGGIVKGLSGVPLIVNGTADHVHVLMRVPAGNGWRTWYEW
jgi:hypothetical protein